MLEMEVLSGTEPVEMEIAGEVVVIGGGGETFDFFESYQDGGNRTDYSTAFAGVGWNNETFKPKYDIKPTNAYLIFNNSKIAGDLVAILGSLGVVFDLSKATNTQAMFAKSAFTRLGVIDVTSSTNSTQTDNLVNSSPNLIRIDKIVVNDKTKFATNTFFRCTALQYVGFDPETINNTITIGYSDNLTLECLENIVHGLKDRSGESTQYTLTIGSTNYAKLTDELINEITTKNWRCG